VSIEGERCQQRAKLISRKTMAQLTLLLVAVIVLITVLRYGVFGYRETGVVDSPSELPKIGGHFAGFRPTGPLRFCFFYDPRGTDDYLICGHASQSEIEELCQRLGLSFSTTRLGRVRSPTQLAWVNSRLLDEAEASGDKRVFWKGPFSKGDYMICGYGTPVGEVLGAFRKRDGWFMLHVVYDRLARHPDSERSNVGDAATNRRVAAVACQPGAPKLEEVSQWRAVVNDPLRAAACATGGQNRGASSPSWLDPVQ
jgi:hypothetical protein